MTKIVIGAIMIIGGLSGKLVLVGTQSGLGLAVLGVVMVIWGIARIMKSRRV